MAVQNTAAVPDDLPSPVAEGNDVWQLTKFPLAFPLGHVQLYVAAAAAAAGRATSISVGLDKDLPHRPVAWIEVDSKLAVHPRQSHRRPVSVSGIQPVFLPAKGAISSLPVTAQAPGVYPTGINK